MNNHVVSQEKSAMDKRLDNILSEYVLEWGSSNTTLAKSLCVEEIKQLVQEHKIQTLKEIATAHVLPDLDPVYVKTSERNQGMAKLYLLSNETITAVARYYGVSVETVRKTLKKFCNNQSPADTRDVLRLLKASERLKGLGLDGNSSCPKCLGKGRSFTHSRSPGYRALKKVGFKFKKCVGCKRLVETVGDIRSQNTWLYSGGSNA